jgi:hypothetical protein
MKRLICLLILFVFVFVSNIQSQETISRYIYVVSSTDEAYYIHRFDRISDSSTLIFEQPVTILDGFTSYVASDEVAALDALIGDSTDVATLPVNTSIGDVSVSADNQRIAFVAGYRYCFRQQVICYGSTQLVIIDSHTNTASVIFNLGMHSHSYFSNIPENLEINSAYIGDITWLNDDSAVLVSLHTGFAGTPAFNPLTLIAVPLDDPTQAFALGEAISWAAHPREDQIATITYYNNDGGLDTRVNRIAFDLATQQTTVVSYPPNEYLFYNLAYLNDDLLGLAVVAEGLRGGLIIFKQDRVEVSPQPSAGTLSSLIASPDGQIILGSIQAEDSSTLWRINRVDEELITEPFFSEGVTLWSFDGDGHLLIHQAETLDLQLLNRDGDVIESIALADVLPTGHNGIWYGWGAETISHPVDR